eukprot:8197669-Lingulodinium_polyedra.AAC.1
MGRVCMLGRCWLLVGCVAPWLPGRRAARLLACLPAWLVGQLVKHRAGKMVSTGSLDPWRLGR